VRDQFLVEVGAGEKIGGLPEMNRLFQAWVETAYHQAVHSETGEEPIARWARASPSERAVPDPGRLREAAGGGRGMAPRGPRHQRGTR
jgi:putative transposase